MAGWPNPQCRRKPASRNSQSSPHWRHQVPTASIAAPTPERWDPSRRGHPHMSSQRMRYMSCDLQVYESFLYVHRAALKKKSLLEIKYSSTAEIFPSQVMRPTNSSLFCQRKIIMAHHLTKCHFTTSVKYLLVPVLCFSRQNRHFKS